MPLRFASSLIFILAFGFLFSAVPDAFAETPAVPTGLIPPTEIAGYDPSIQVGGGDLIRLVVLITNYVLGFLGILSITAIIYAGILYVANFGNEDMTTKAKNMIFYVAIGILIIILSFAIVNTLVGVVDRGRGPAGPGGAPGRISPGDRPVVTLESLIDVEGKDFIFPLITGLKNLGDLCVTTPIGLLVNETGCAQNELIADTDSDGIANVLDTDDDDDGTADELDADDDGDGICEGEQTDPTCSSGPDLCPDTLSFVSFKVGRIEERKLQIDRVAEEEYQNFTRERQGCAEYQRKADIDGDGVADRDDCDADGDGLIDNEECSKAFFDAFPPGNVEDANITPETTFRGIRVFDVVREDIDKDDDNDGVPDFSALPEERDLLLRQIANNFQALENFIRITCATLPQTRKVQDFCGFDPQGKPFGKLVRLLDTLSSDLKFTDFENFNVIYQEFIAIAKAFPRVQVQIDANTFEGSLPTDNTPLRISFNASNTLDPFQEFCPIAADNYLWFVNKTLDFSQGLAGILKSSVNAPDGKGVFFNFDFTEAGIFNVQLLVRSACKFNTVNPGAGEAADVDAAIAGLANARIQVFPPRARLVVKVNGLSDQGAKPVKVITGAQAPVSFDLTQSTTNRGAFQFLTFDCGEGTGNTIQGTPAVWTFQCTYTNARGTKTVRLQARDGEGDVERIVTLQFSDIIATLDIKPGLQGSTGITFTFDASKSNAAVPIRNFTYIVEEKRGANFVEIQRFQQQTVTFQFPRPGVYRVKLEVSTGGAAAQVSTDEKTVTIEEQEPVAAFRIRFPETIRPARALFDGSLSFHPDFPQTDVLSFSWQVDGVTLRLKTPASTGPFTYEQEKLGSDQRIFFEFQTVGEHEVILTVSKGSKSDKVRETTKVNTLLGVDFTTNKLGAHVDELITFTPRSDKALGFFWDFGDDTTLVADSKPVVHKYTKQGVFIVKLTVEDGAGNTNAIQKKVRVGLQDKPVAITQVFVNNIEQDLTKAGCVEVTRLDSVLFDAGKSTSIKGETSGISFLWEIEDFEEVFRTRSFTRIFKELTRGGCVDIDLTVTDLTTNATDEAETISIEVINKKPELTDLRFTVSESQVVTPLTVNVTAVGFRDVDGRVVRFRWWYFEEGQGQKKLDLQVTDIGRTSFVIGPRNIEGTTTTYFFVVEIEDNDGAVTNSFDALGPSKPLIVTNGPNIAPVAEFVTDRSVVKSGDSVTFTSTSRDPLGEFIPSAGYQWDFEGDGEIERGISGAKVTHRYDQPGTYRPTLKVTKNGLTSQYDMTLRVIAATASPEAAFVFIASGVKVKFISNSTVDPSLENKDLKHSWDFDTTVDTDGNGIPDDDADSALLSPTHEFEGTRDVSVALKVIDSVGSSDRVVRKIPFIKKDVARGPLGATKVIPLKAVMKTNPTPNPIDGKVYLKPPSGDVVFNFVQSIGKIQEYRFDSNIFVDTDGDGIPGNDIDNKTHKSWKDGSSFKSTYREVDGKIRTKLTLVSIDAKEKSVVIDVVFSEKEPEKEVEKIESPDEILTLLQNVPVISFDISSPFTAPNEKITFDASKTRFPGEQTKEFRWDFDGDGLVDEISFEPTISYAYPKAGAFEIILEAVSDQGLQGEYSQTVFVRGGLTLPVANFEFILKDNEVQFTNLSTFDPSQKEEQIQFQWTFAQLDGRPPFEWATWEKVPELTLQQREFNQPPLAVTSLIRLEPAESGTGVLPRQVVLGAEDFVARLEEGTTFLDANEQPFVGELKFAPEEDSAISAPGEEKIFLFQTGVTSPLTASNPVRLIFTGVILNAKLYQVEAEGKATFLGDGKVENNLTTFTIQTFGGRYLVTGQKEEGELPKGEAIGVSTVRDPVKVFLAAGLYQVTLEITDAVGEKSQKTEVITIDKDLKLVEPSAVPPEELAVPTPSVPEAPILPVPEIRPEEGGLSYWWLFFIIVSIFVFGGVVYVVVRTIRQRQAEIEGKEAAPGEKPVAPPVVEAEVVVAPPKAEPEKKAEEKKEEEKKDKGGPTPPTPAAPGGPIPDWLKG